MVDIISHFIVSLLIGVSLWKLFDGSKKTIWKCLAFSLLSGFFLDIDHIYDYIANYGLVWNFDHFINEDYFTVTNYVFFHGFEYVVILGLISVFIEDKVKRLYVIILATSMFAHLFIDIMLGGVSIKEYFLIYRIINHFQA